MPEDYPLYHITRWGTDEVAIYNCNFCQYDTQDLAMITKHITEDHPYNEYGVRINLRGEQYSNFDGSPFLKNVAPANVVTDDKSAKVKE
jgi:hypothetical protein